MIKNPRTYLTGVVASICMFGSAKTSRDNTHVSIIPAPQQIKTYIEKTAHLEAAMRNAENLVMEYLKASTAEMHNISVHSRLRVETIDENRNYKIISSGRYGAYSGDINSATLPAAKSYDKGFKALLNLFVEEFSKLSWGQIEQISDGEIVKIFSAGLYVDNNSLTALESNIRNISESSLTKHERQNSELIYEPTTKPVGLYFDINIRGKKAEIYLSLKDGRLNIISGKENLPLAVSELAGLKAIKSR